MADPTSPPPASPLPASSAPMHSAPAAPPSSAATGPAIDDETTARAALTFLVDGPDALMYALLIGAGGAVETFRLLLGLAHGGRDRDPLRTEVDRLFAAGTARWGGRLTPEGMGAFHRSLDRWLRRIPLLPSTDSGSLAAWLSQDGKQWIIAPHSPYWPHRFDDLPIHADLAPPLCIWGRGDPGALVRCPAPIAIVGSRAADDYGMGVARALGERAARDGHLVVSGGAMGVDAAAHWGALSASAGGADPDANGATVAVFAGGLNHIGPRVNRRLFDAIDDQGGALISELCPGTVPEARRFLLRNRLIAALSSVVVVAQARLRSGALSTARHAGELNRVVYAVPGDITAPNNAGCNRLIHEGKAIIVPDIGRVEEICHAPHPAGTPHPAAAMQPDGAAHSAGIERPADTGRPTDAIVRAAESAREHPRTPSRHCDASSTDPGNRGSSPHPSTHVARANRVTRGSSATARQPSLEESAGPPQAGIGPPAAGDEAPMSGTPRTDASRSGTLCPDGSGHDETDRILAAIRRCRRTRSPTTADDVLAAVNDPRTDGSLTIDRVLAGLAELELRGEIVLEHGGYTPVRR